MGKSLKEKALSAVAWNAIQRYGALLVSFVTNIVLARILSPDDFGLIGLLTVFIAVASSVTESGFNSALIQQKEVTQKDYSTVFYWNLIMSLIMVATLYFAAPFIARYFGRPLLKDILRLESVILVINSLCIVQTTRLMKFLQFKVLAIRTLVATVVASIVGITLAYFGFGVWALVWQGIVNSFVGAVLLWNVTNWRPMLQYSWESFKRMFRFGLFIFISSICNTLYINVQSFIIGRNFSISNLGYYSQAKKLEHVAADGTASILNVVLFPIYASIANDRERHRTIVRKNIRIISFLVFPMMTTFIAVADPLITILFTDKWVASVPIFQILCIVGMMTPINMANVEVFRSIGNGGMYLTLQTIKRIVGLALILSFVRYGMYPMLWATVFVSFTTYGINLFFTHRFFGYSCGQQLADIIPNLLYSVCSYIIAVIGLKLLDFDNRWAQLIIGSLILCLTYLLMAAICKSKALKEIVTLLKTR